MVITAADLAGELGLSAEDAITVLCAIGEFVLGPNKAAAGWRRRTVACPTGQRPSRNQSRHKGSRRLWPVELCAASTSALTKRHPVP